MKRKTLTLLMLMAAFQVVMAAIPNGYYKSIDGEKSLGLKAALCDIIKNHKVLGYSSLWEYYPSTYFVPENPNQVRDMYCDDARYYNGTGAVVAGMNKEHTVPKSWWGGSTSAAPGNDLYNVIPSESTANSRKSNYSLGIVTTNPWTNGCTTVGKGTVNGHSASFFEPKDEYKGDFARIYFYMATCYPDLAWDSNNADAMTNKSQLTLQSWIIPMLLEWMSMDPINDEEIQRNENIYKIQGNRNPFIDYPELVEYIWGGKTAETFDLANHTPNTGGDVITLVAGLPKFSLEGGSSFEPLDIASETKVTVKGYTDKATLHVRVNNGEWETIEPKKGYNSVSQSEYYTAASKDIIVRTDTRIDAYCTIEGREPSETVTYYYRAVNFDNDFVLYEAFDEVTSGDNITNTGSSSAWSGNTNFPTVTKAYKAGNAIKIGTGSAAGSITSRPLQFTGNALSVSVDVKGWTAVEGDLIVTVTGADSQRASYTATMADGFETLTFNFNGVSANATLTIATSTKRAFVDNIKVVAVGTSGIDGIAADKQQVSTVTYNLSGQRVNASTKGIVIVNGRKVAVK